MESLLYHFMVSILFFWNAHLVIMFHNLTFKYTAKFGAVLYENSELNVSVVTSQNLAKVVNFDKGGKH